MEAVSTLRVRPNIAPRWTLADRLRRDISAPTLISLRPPVCRHIQLPMQIKCSSTGSPGFEARTEVEHSDVGPDQHLNEVSGSYSSTEYYNSEKIDHNGSTVGSLPSKIYGKAKLHDFCLGIPFGGFVFAGGVIGFLFSRSLDVLGTGVLLGGAIVAFGTCSLKVWRQGKSSIPFVLGQAAIATILLVKDFQTYSLSKKLLPSGFYVAFSAAMLCFYVHVLLSGGNPPPKKSAVASAT